MPSKDWGLTGTETNHSTINLIEGTKGRRGWKSQAIMEKEYLTGSNRDSPAQTNVEKDHDFVWQWLVLSIVFLVSSMYEYVRIPNILLSVRDGIMASNAFLLLALIPIR